MSADPGNSPYWSPWHWGAECYLVSRHRESFACCDTADIDIL